MFCFEAVLSCLFFFSRIKWVIRFFARLNIFFCNIFLIAFRVMNTDGISPQGVLSQQLASANICLLNSSRPKSRFLGRMDGVWEEIDDGVGAENCGLR